MILNHAEKIIEIKIVYYGPAMSGKTTSIKYLFSYFGKEESLQSIDSTIGRTLFFDFGVLQFKGAEWNLKLLLYSATGQDFYASTRPATLNGVDSLIFVVDSQSECIEHNYRSWNELREFFGNDLYDMPIVIAFNKFDLDNAQKFQETEFLNFIQFKKFTQISIEKTIALKGKGVLESFKKVLNFMFPQLVLI